MGITTFLSEYILWHYGQALRDIWELEKNFLWFGYHFFSIPLLFQTIFSPFYRIHESYKGWATMEVLLESVVANVVSRFVGLILRSVIIIAGLIFECFVIVFLVPVLIFWFLLPLLFPGLFIVGVSILF